MCDGDGQPPNPLIVVYINTLPSVKWTKFAQTEIVEVSYHLIIPYCVF